MKHEVKNQFVIKLGANKFMATDANSGGYPYEVDDFNRAQTYPTIEKAIGGASYYNKQVGFARIMRVVAVELEDCTARVDQLNEYEQRLAALKQEYGVK